MFVARNLRTTGDILSKQVGSQARLPWENYLPLKFFNDI